MARRINLTSINVARSNTIRDINRQIILNYIRENGSVSRADIAAITELQRSTVSLIVDELLKADLIEETEGESSGGRPPQLLSLKTFKPVAIGIDLGRKITTIGTSDLSGRLLETRAFPTDLDEDRMIERIIENTKYFIQQGGGAIEAIGIAVPGLVESWHGSVINVPHLEWHYPTIAERIREATGLPVLVENDTNAAALAELWLGRPEISNVRDFAVVLIHRGIGTGIVIDGQIYRGRGGVAGEFGHMTIGSNAPVACAAGRYECWEAFASERSALARYEKLQGCVNGDAKIIFEQLVGLALAGNENAVKALKETAHYIGVGISNLVQGLSPEVTIVIGTIVRAWSLISDDIQRGAEGGMCQGYPSVNIIPSTLGTYPTLMGAISLVLANKFGSFHIN
ncbi:MAG: ROK family transcriptional regulator [Acidobacteria bacterium]|nr:ROK family transcriptional regulator [Acidobacteriota bacterium]MBK8811208.1 ROK family transcriptional regulator [Acidobacteriota bacterium]